MPILEFFPPQLECNTIVFRVLKPSWFQEGFISSQAFVRAQYSDGTFESGLSVVNNEDNAKKPLRKPMAITTLHVGKIRDIKIEGSDIVLDVIPGNEIDPFFDEEKIVHAEIRGMPPPDDNKENRLLAERIATVLLDLIKNRPFVWERPAK